MYLYLNMYLYMCIVHSSNILSITIHKIINEILYKYNYKLYSIKNEFYMSIINYIIFILKHYSIIYTIFNFINLFVMNMINDLYCVSNC